MLTFKSILPIVGLITISCLSTNLHAQAECVIEPPFTDSNNDGLADQFVSPDAIVRNTTIDCSNHSIAAGAVLIDSSIDAEVTVDSGARIVRSNVSFGAEIGAESRVVDSGVDGFGTTVGLRSVVAQESFVTDRSQVADDVVIRQSEILDSDIGSNSIVNGSRVTTFTLGDDVRVINGSELIGNAESRFQATIEAGGRVRNGATVLGPITIGPNAQINARVVIEGFKFIGGNFRIGEDSTIGFGGDILGEVIIGKRVTIGNEPDIGGGNRIGNDATLGFGVETMSDVIIRRNAQVGGEVFLDARVVVGQGASIGEQVTVGTDAVIRAEATVGDGAQIGSGAIIKSGADVPAGFVVLPNTVFPNDYIVDVDSIDIDELAPEAF